MEKHELTGTYASFDGGDFIEIDGKRVDDPNDALFPKSATEGFFVPFSRKPSLDDLRAGLIGQIKRAKPR